MRYDQKKIEAVLDAVPTKIGPTGGWIPCSRPLAVIGALAVTAPSLAVADRPNPPNPPPGPPSFANDPPANTFNGPPTFTPVVLTGPSSVPPGCGVLALDPDDTQRTKRR